MKYKWSAAVLPLLLCLAADAGAQTFYVESTEAQFTAGSHNSTYISGAGSDVTIGLDYYGRGAGLSAPGSDEWFNPAWKYRQPLSLNSTNPATLTNYPVEFTLNTQAAVAAGRMNADGSDIRFTTAAAAGSAAPLSYYIESGMNTSATKIWVKLPSVPTGAGTIYLYSGSTSAAAASSITDTFTLGNNFTAVDGSVPSTATWSNIESAVSQSGSLRDIQANRLRLLYGSPLGTRHYGLRSGIQYSFAAGRHYRAEMNARASGSDSWSSFTLCQTIYTYSYDQDDWLRFSIKHSAGGATYELVRSDYGTKTTLASGSVSAGFHGVDFLINSASFTVLLDGSQIYGAANNLAFNSPYIYLEATSASSSLEEYLFDSIFVQSYSKPEPAYGSPGAEQGRRYPSGSFTSQVTDTSAPGTSFQIIDWAAVTPSSSSATFEMRAHDTDILLSTFTAAPKGGNPAVTGRYVQYRLNLATLDPRYTAAVSSVVITYGSPPLAPAGAIGTALSETSIKWNWTDNSSGQYQEDGFMVLDATGALKGSVASGTTYWIETPLSANTLYARQVLGYNASGNGPPSAVSKYTLATAPNVGCDKSTGTWLSGTLTCINLAGFGGNGVAYYRYAWTQTPDRTAWTGTETQWLSGQILNTAASSGNWYLHVKSYNGENIPLAGYQTYGPYWYDKSVPTFTGFSPSSSPWTNAGLSSQVPTSDSGGSKLYRIRYRWTTSSDKPGSGWQAWDYAISGNDTASSNFTIGSAGQWYLHVEVEDTAGNVGYAYSGIYKIDLTNPTGSITINGGDAYTPRVEVILALTYADSESGVKNLAYKNLGGVFSTPELPQATTAWALAAGDGSKQVYVQVTDNSGRTFQSADTITLDSRTSLLGAPVNGTASGVMGEPAETFAAQAVLSWAPTGDKLEGKTVSFYFNGSTRTALTDSLGEAATGFYVPAASGTYVYSVSFSTDGVYSATSSTGTLTAARRGASLITEDVNTNSGVDFIAKATLKDFATEALITGATVTFYFEGSSQTAVTNGIGVATVTFTAPVPVSFYDYTASYEGGPVYAPKSAGSRVGVGLRITSLVVPGLTVLAQSEFNAQATLMDGAVPVQGSTISFVFQGSTQTAFTNASGVALSSFTAPTSSGTYAYTAAFPGDDTYAPSSGAADLTVNRRPLSLAGDILQGYVNASFQARAVLSDGTNAQKVPGKTIVFVFESSSATALTDANGVSTAVFNSGSLPRASTCYYYFAGDSDYGFADSTAAVSIERRPTALAASDTTAMLSSSFTAIAELKDTAFTPTGVPDKTITFTFRGEEKTAVTDALGVASATYQTGLSTGSYEFYASFAEDGVYLADNDTGTVTMDKRPSVLSAYPKFVFAFDNIQAVADLKDGVTGDYISSQTIIFNYSGVAQSTTTGASGGVAGRAYSVFAGTGVAGTYSYFADFAGNALYSAKSSTASITVSPRPVNLSAFPQTTVLGDTITVTAEFRDGITNVPAIGKTIKMVFQSSTAYVLTGAGGAASVNFFSPASTGAFNWLAQFDGDQAYAFASSTGTITVNRRSPTLTALPSTKYIWDSVFFSATFFDEITPLAAKQLSFYFQGSTLTVPTNGSGLATAGPFASLSTAGAYGYTVGFAGDANYSAQSASSTLVVSSRPSNINLGPTTVIANSTFTLSATLADTLNPGLLIVGKAVNFTLQGSTYGLTAFTNASGIASAVFRSSPTTGPYTYSAAFSGNLSYAGSSSSETVTVTVRPSVLEMADYSPPANSTFTASAVLKDFTTGVTIATKTVSFLFLGVTKTPVTNAVGYASTTYVTLASTLSYPISASFAGDSLYSAASISKTVFPGRRNTALQTSDILNAVAMDTFTVTARLTDYDLGTNIAGSTITFSFSGSSNPFTITAFTNAGGTASAVFTAPVSTGNYTYNAAFAGDSLFNPNTNTSSVLVDRRTLTLLPGDLTSIPAASTFTATALLKDGSVTISTQTLTFVFFASNKNAVTNGIGVASTTFAAPVSTGIFSYTVSYAGNGLYKPGSASGNVEVVLRASVIELGPVSVIANSTFTLAATLNDLFNEPLTGKSVSFTLQGASYTLSAVTNSSGVASVVYTSSPTTGAYDYSATFGGDVNYTGAYSSNTVTVTKRPSVLEMADYYPPSSSTFTVSAVLKDFNTGVTIATKTISFLFMAVTKTPVTNAVGYASTTYVTLATTQSYTISASFSGDALYSAAAINKMVYPGKRDTVLLTSNVMDAVAKDSFTVTATLRDYDLGSTLNGSTITFSFSGSSNPFTITTFTNSTGTASAIFTAPTATGTYTYSVIYPGATLYNGASSTSTVLVNRRTLLIEPGDLTSIPANSTFTASALMRDGAITISTKTLTFVFFTTKTAVTNGIGVASTTFVAPLSTGTFNYKVTYTGDALYNPATFYASVGVVLKPTVLEVLDVLDAVVSRGFDGTAKLRDIELGNELVLSTKTIRLTFSTATVFATTDFGVATAAFVAPTATGTYTYTATFFGDGVYGASQSTGTVVVGRNPVLFSLSANPMTPYTARPNAVQSSFTITAVLSDGLVAGLNLEGQSITFVFENSTKTATTNELGIASVTYLSQTSSGTYSYYGYYYGNLSYNPNNPADSVKSLTIIPRPTYVTAWAGNGELTGDVWTFHTYSPSAFINDGPSNEGIQNLAVNFVSQGATITSNASSAVGLITSSGPFSWIQNAGVYPITVNFNGNATYAPSTLTGGTDMGQPSQGKIEIHLTPARVALTDIQEVYPDQDVIISGTAYDYWGRAWAREYLKGKSVWYSVSSTPCIMPDCTATRTWGANSYANVDNSFVATATVHTPLTAGDYPVEVWFNNDSSFYQWRIAENQRILRVGRRLTYIIPDNEPFKVGAMLPIEITVKLADLTQSLAGINNKSMDVILVTTQTLITGTGGAAGKVKATFSGMSVGTYTYTARFPDGDGTYMPFESTGTVVVEKNTTILTADDVLNVPAGNSFIARATLVVSTGGPQIPTPGKTINFVFTSTALPTIDLSAVTNSIGVATVTYWAPYVPGGYSYTATLVEDAEFKGSSDISNAVQVVKRITITAALPGAVYILENFNSTATLTDSDLGGAAIPAKPISFILHKGPDANSSANTNSIGVASVTYASPASSGTFEYSATFPGDALYAVSSDTKTVVVSRRVTALDTVDITTPTNNAFTLSATLKDITFNLGVSTPLAGLQVKFIFNGEAPQYGTTDANGNASASFIAPAIAMPNYPYSATFEGTQTYNSVVSNRLVNVRKRNTFISGDPIVVPSGTQFTAKGRLIDEFGQQLEGYTLNFVFTGTATYNGSAATDVLGDASTPFISPLSTGTYNYTISFAGDSTFEAGSDAVNSVTVNVASTTLSTFNYNVTVNDVFIATATLKGKTSGVGILNKLIDYTYKGVYLGQNLTDVNGIAVRPITPLTTGVFELGVAFAGDTAFFSSTASGTITVNRRLSGAVMPAMNADVGALFIASVTLSDLSVVPSTWIAGRTVNFSFQGSPQSAVTNNVGVATVAYTAPSPGGTSYQVTAAFDGDPIYASTNTANWVNVAKRVTNITLSSGNVTALEVFNASATLKWGLIPVPGKTIQFTYKGEVLVSGVTDADGHAFLQFNAGPSSGPWRLDGAFTNAVDPDYSVTAGSSAITVLQRACVVRPDNISVSVYDLFNTTVTFMDVASSSTPAGKVAKVAWNWIGSSQTTNGTDSAGRAYYGPVTAPSSSGTYKVEAFYTGDATYAPGITSTATVTVNRRASQLSVADASIMIGRIFFATATLKNEAALLANKDVLFTFEGRNFNVKTVLGVAVATYTVTVSTGPNRIDAVFSGDSSYLSSTASATVTASMRPTTLTPQANSVIANETFKTTATLTDVDGNLVQNQPVSFTFNGSTLWANTNSIGVATVTFTANVATGAHSVPVTFPGDYKYVTSSNTLTVTVTRRPTTIVPLSNVTVPALNVFFATATLQDMDLATVPSAPIRFLFQGSTFNVLTGGDGVAVSTWAAPASSGTYYRVYAYFDGDATFGTSASTFTLTVQQRPTAIALNNISVAALDMFTATAAVTDQYSAGIKVSTRTVSFTFSSGGGTSALTDGIGIATASYQASATANSNYTVTGTFAGDATFASTTTVAVLNVAKRNAFVNGVYISTRVFDVFTASGTFYDSVSSAPVNGHPISFSLQNIVSTQTSNTAGVGASSGIASVSFTAPAASGTYALAIWSPGDATYNATTVYMSSVTLARRNNSITLTGPAASIINSSFTTTGTMVDALPAGNVQSRGISFLFQGAARPMTTNVSGTTSTVYTANLTSGTYELSAAFAGDASYNPSFSSRTVITRRYPTLLAAPAITVTMMEILTATATLRDYTGSTVPAKALVFYFGSSYTSVTDGFGVAYSTYSAAVASGTYQLPLSFAGDTLYDSTGTTIPLLVNKRAPLIAMTTVAVQALNIFTASATLTDARVPAQKLNGQTVDFQFFVGVTTFTDSGVTDGNGLAVANFTAPLSTGTYQLRAQFAGNTTYYPLTAYSSVTVSARPSWLMQDNATGVIDEIFRTTATLVDLATSQLIAARTINFTFGSSSSGVTGAGGKASVTFSAPSSSGPVQLNSAFAGDATYNAAASTATLTVLRRPAVMAAPDISAIIDEVFTATVTVSDGLNAIKVATRTVTFVFGSTFTAVTPLSGVAVSTFSAPSSSGTYYAAVNFSGDARYLPAGTTAQLTVTRRPSEISPEAVSAWTARIFTATATLRDTLNVSSKPAGRPLTFFFSGSSFTALTDINGVAVSTFMAPSSSGTVRLDVSFGGDARYLLSASSAAVTVLRRLPNLALTPATIQALQVLTATGTLTDTINPGDIVSGRALTFSFSGENFISATGAGGVAVSTFAGPVSSGTYMVEAAFAGDALYDTAYTSGSVTVIQRPALLMQDNSAAAIDEIFRTTATLVDPATSAIIAGRTIAFTFGSTAFAATGADGKASANFSAPSSSGPFQLNSAFAGDATYAAAASTGTLMVTRRPAVMTAPDISGIIDEVFAATATVTDGLNAAKVDARALAFIFSNSTFTDLTDIDGVAVSTFSAPLSSGVYYAAVDFAGDSRFLPQGTTVQLTVDRRPSGITTDELMARAGQIFTATATLRDTLNPAGAPAGRPLVFFFGSSSFTALTDSDGVAVSTFMSPSSSGTVRLDISFGGDGRYQASASSAPVIVLRRLSRITFDPATIRALDVLYATATLTDLTDPGTYVSGRDLTFSFSAGNFVSRTDAGGIAVSTFAGPASSGTYVVEATFAGDDIYDTSYATGAVVVIQRQAGIAVPDSSAYPFEEFLAAGTLRDSVTQAALAGSSLVFTLDGASTGAVTNGAGLASAAYTPPGVFGSYELTADFAGDATYAAAGSSGTVAVMQRPTLLAAADSGAIALDVFTAAVTLSDIRFSTAAAGKEVTFTFESRQSTAATDADGLASVQFTAPVSSGVYYFEADFAGDTVYALAATTGAITVETRTTRVVARDTNANVGEPFILEAQLLDPAKEEQPGYFVTNAQVEFKFKDRNNVVLDTKFGVTNEIGKATATFSGPGAPDVYYYTARFTGDYTYSPSSATAMVKVGLLTSIVAFDVETVALENFAVKAKLTDYLATTLDDKLVRFTFLGSSRTALTNADGNSGMAVSSFTAPASSGTYYYNVYFDGDSIYSASNATATLTVTLRPSSLVAFPAATMAFSSFTAAVQLQDTILTDTYIGGRDVNIVFNGSTITANTDAVTGLASAVFFAPVSSGAFTFQAYFDGDDTYAPTSRTGFLTVTLRPTNMLSYNVSDLTASSTFTAKVQIKDNNNQPIPGLGVEFDFGGVFAIATTDALGFAENIYTAPASSGVYTYTAVFQGDPFYAPSSASGSVAVGPRPTLVFTSPASAKLGAPVELAARLVDVKTNAGIEGQLLNFYFEGSTLTSLTDSLGSSTVTFSAPPSTGTYYYEAAHSGDGITYLGSTSSSTVTIAVNLTSLQARENISLKIYEPLAVDATLKDDIGLNLPGLPVTFSFEGLDSASVTDEFGKATATFATMGLASTGTYNYTADYAGDTLYVASSDTSSVVTVYRRDSLLIARDSQAVPSKAFIAEAKFYDNVNGSAFMGATLAGKTISFDLYYDTFTETRSAVTSALGVSTVGFISPVSTGTYLLVARFADDDPVYIGAISSAVLNVFLDDGTGAIKTKLRLDSATAYITKTFIASGTLTATDEPVPGKNILFEFFNGVSTAQVVGLTDDGGLATASFTAPASSGVYNMTATFPSGDPNYSTASGTSTLTALRYPDSLTALDVAAYAQEPFRAKAVLRDELTQAFVAGKTVTFEFFNGVSTLTATAVTSSTGSAETDFTAPALPGAYTYTARFAGDAAYVPAQGNASVLIASHGSSTFLVGYEVFVGTGEVFAASATLTSQGLPVQGKAVAITFQGLLRFSTTNAQGLAFSTFTAPASSGTFAFQADFTGDATYNTTLATAPVSVVFRKQVEQPTFTAEVASTSVTLAWTPVTVPSAQVVGYEIDTAATLRPQTWDSQGSVSSTQTLSYTCPVSTETATFLKVKTMLADDQESPTSLIVEVPLRTYDNPERVPNYYYMSPGANPQDWAAWVKIPGKVMDKIGAADFSLEVKKVINPNFLAAYTITPSGASADLASDLKTSDKKGVMLTIAYPKDGMTTSALQLPAIYWFNGAEWVKLGGEINVQTGEVVTYSRVLGQFAVRYTTLSSSFALTKVAPRVFSPEDPGTAEPRVNRVRFYFENPTGGEVTIRIFDITGALVRRNLESEGASIMFWNGKDQSGAAVRGGVYIYQIEASDKVLTGTVVVAK